MDLKQPHLPIDLLYSGAETVVLTRTSENSLDLVVERGYFASVFERGERDPSLSPLHVGDEIALARMHIRVLAEHNGMPTRVRFELSRALVDSRRFAWQGPELAELPMPSIGETLYIAPASGL